MDADVTVTRVAAGLRAAAMAGKDRADAGGFLVGLHPTSDRYYGSVAVPPAGLDPQDVSPDTLIALRAAFGTRGRTVRLELVEQDAPGVREALVDLGLQVEARVPLLACDAAGLVAVPVPEGVVLERIAADAPRSRVHEALSIARAAFDGAPEVTPDDVARMPQLVLDGSLVLARDAADGAPLGSGYAMAAQEGVSELTGIGVRADARGRGIGAALTAEITAATLHGGADLAVLSPGDDGAHRIYTRCGFRLLADMVFLRDPGAVPVP